MKPNISRQRVPDHVPGPMEEAAVRAYFERGSQQALDRNRWRVATIVSLTISALLAAGMVVVATKQDVYVMQVSKDVSGQLQVGGVASKFMADEDSQMAWASNYAQVLTEITPAIWRRNVERVMNLSAGVATDQVRAYLQQPESNPAALLDKNNLYVREYHRKSVNKVAENTYLVRYELISRIAPNAASSTKAFAMTVTLTHLGHKTREDVFKNPEGLAALNFSLSEESKK
jgi:type IV secretory pathway TrbF-like protein